MGTDEEGTVDRTAWRDTLWALPYLAAIVVLQAPDAVFGDGLFWSHDLRHHHFPWRHWAATRWARGEVPLWASDVANGFPLMADGQAGVFYPVNVLLGLLLPAHVALTWSILLHQLLAGMGAFWLARTLRLGRTASLLAGVAWMLSGFLVAHVTYAGMQAVAAWVPVGMAAVVHLARGEGWRWALLWAVATAAMLTAGHPQAAAIGLLGCLVVFLGHVRWRRPGPWLRAGAGAAAGLLAASPQVLASLELAGHSAREGGVDPEFADIGALPPQEIVNAVLPRFWGWERPADIPLTYVHKWTGYFGTGENHWEMCFYLGIPVVLLAAWGVRHRGGRTFKVLALLSLLLMLGGRTPLYGLLRLLPGFGYFRFPVRFSLLLGLAVAVLAARGLDALLCEPWGRRVPRLLRGVTWGIGFFVVGAGLAHLALLRHGDALRGALLAALGPRPGAEARVDAIYSGLLWDTSPASPGVWWPALLALAWVLLLVAHRRGRLGRAATGAGMLLLVVVDLTAFGSDYNPRIPRPVVERRPATLPAARPPGLQRYAVVDRVQPTELDRDLIASSLGLLYGLHDVIVLSPLLLPRNESLLALAGLDVGLDHGPAKARDLVEHLDVAEMMGVGSLLTVHPLEHPDLELVRQVGRVRVYRDRFARPRAALVGCVRRVAGPEEALEVLAREDARQVAAVEGEVGLGCQRPAGRVRILRYQDERVDLEVRAESPGLVLLADTWYPGWTALLDGEEVPIHRANATFRGVEVGAGRHHLAFVYRPWWLPAVPIGLGTWAALLLSGIVVVLHTGLRALR